jgi:hypothetical protein
VRRADHSSRGVLPSVVCLSVIVKPRRNEEALAHIGLSSHRKKKLDEGGWSTPRPGRFTPGKETRYPLYRRLGGPPGPVWTGAENLATTEIRSPDRPARSESLY